MSNSQKFLFYSSFLMVSIRMRGSWCHLLLSLALSPCLSVMSKIITLKLLNDIHAWKDIDRATYNNTMCRCIWLRQYYQLTVGGNGSGRKNWNTTTTTSNYLITTTVSVTVMSSFNHVTNLWTVKRRHHSSLNIMLTFTINCSHENCLTIIDYLLQRKKDRKKSLLAPNCNLN